MFRANFKVQITFVLTEYKKDCLFCDEIYNLLNQNYLQSEKQDKLGVGRFALIFLAKMWGQEANVKSKQNKTK